MFLACLIFFQGAWTISSNDLHDWAKALDVTYTIITNIESDEYFTFQVTLQNNGLDEIHNNQSWCIYFNQNQHILDQNGLVGRKGSDVDTGLTVYHVNGGLFKLCPNSDWMPLLPQTFHSWTLRAVRWINQDSTLFPNWFLTCETDAQNNTENNQFGPAVLASTKNVTLNRPDFVDPFLTAKMYKRSSNDQFSPKSPTEIFDDISDKKPKARQYGLPVIPQPAYVNMQPSNIQTDKDGNDVPENGVKIHKRIWNIEYHSRPGEGEDTENWACPDPTKEIEDLQAGTGKREGSLIVQTGYAIKPEGDEPDDLKWRISASSGSIAIVSVNCDAQKMAIQFVKKLIEKLKKDRSAMLFRGKIGGRMPRFNTRSVMLDVARNFHGKYVILKLLDIMAELNMNQLHLRLADDEGWRIEINGLPELTRIGSSRCWDPSANQCLMPQFGNEPGYDFSPGDGYLTVEEYKEILTYAKNLDIRIVPEISAPSHAAAAIQAMNARGDAEYIMQDSEQYLDEFISSRGFYNNVMNPCMDSTYTFLEKVVLEISILHSDFMDVHNHFHIGGDDIHDNNWRNSPKCEEYIQNNSLNWNTLPLDFLKKYMRIVTQYDFHVDGWEEVWTYTDDGTDAHHVYEKSTWEKVINNNTVLTAYHRNNAWLYDDTSSLGYKMANKDYKVILAPATHTNLDHANDADPNSRGSMRATRFSDLWKTFSFRPLVMNNNALYGYWGKKIDTGCDNSNGLICTELTKPENIAGLEAILWTDECTTEIYLWEQLLPRLTAIAERSWRQATWEDIYVDSSWNAVNSLDFRIDFAKFRYALKFFHRYLENRNIPYHLPKCGIKSNGKNYQNIYTYNPQLFRKKGTGKWKTWSQLNKDGGLYHKTIEVVTSSFNYNRQSYPGEFVWGSGSRSVISAILITVYLLV